MDVVSDLAPAWDQRFEKYGWTEELVGYASDYGISLAIAHDEHGKECLHMRVEQVHMTQPAPADNFPVYGLQIETDEGAGSVLVRVPPRAVVCGFVVAIASLRVRTTAKPGEDLLEEGPESATSGLFWLNVLSLDRPETMVKFAFRSDFNSEDIKRRHQRRTASN